MRTRQGKSYMYKSIEKRDIAMGHFSIAQPQACVIYCNQSSHIHVTHRPTGAGIDLFVDRSDVGVVEAPDY